MSIHLALGHQRSGVTSSIGSPQAAAAFLCSCDDHRCGYENREWSYIIAAHTASGHDPYSASKAAAEIAIAVGGRLLRHRTRNSHLRIATARAGNVIVVVIGQRIMCLMLCEALAVASHCRA